MTKISQIIAAVVALVAVLCIGGWWAGGFGVAMTLFASVGVALLFLARADIINAMPSGAKSAIAWMVFLSILALVVEGARARIEDAKREWEEARKAKAASILDVTTVHYSEAGPGMNIVPGKNVIGLPVGAFTGCLTAPAGWHLTEDHDRRFDGTVKIGKNGKEGRVRSRLDIRGSYAKDDAPEVVQEPLRILEIRGDCATNGIGFVSTSFTPGYKLKSLSAKNNGAQPAAITVWLRPI
jgi:hypothetical protein